MEHSLRGARTLLRELETHLGIVCGETTPDGRITLGREECLGACDAAPMMRIESRYYEGLDSESAKQLLDALEPIEQDPETFRPITALFQWPLGAALIFAGALGLFQVRERTI